MADCLCFDYMAQLIIMHYLFCNSSANCCIRSIQYLPPEQWFEVFPQNRTVVHAFY